MTTMTKKEAIKFYKDRLKEVQADIKKRVKWLQDSKNHLEVINENRYKL